MVISICKLNRKTAGSGHAPLSSGSAFFRIHQILTSNYVLRNLKLY